jgi:hypothetical protein
MKQILINIVFLCIGLGFGALGYSLLIPSETKTKTKTIYVDQMIQEVVRDTIYQEKKIYITPPRDSLLASFEESITDTLQKDTLQVIGDDDIDQERLIAQQMVIIKKQAIDSTDVSKMFDLQSESFADKITIEFWESPLNITGYELTRNKLKLFGFNPNETVSLYLGKQENRLHLKSETMQLVLTKTKQFKTLKL